LGERKGGHLKKGGATRNGGGGHEGEKKTVRKRERGLENPSVAEKEAPFSKALGEVLQKEGRRYQQREEC